MAEPVAPGSKDPLAVLERADAYFEKVERVLALVELALADAIAKESSLRARIAELEAREEWRPTHRHVKRGSDYQVIGTASLQAAEPVGEAAMLVVYRDQKGRLWTRPEAEFDDGRFEPLPAPPAPKGEG